LAQSCHTGAGVEKNFFSFFFSGWRDRQRNDGSWLKSHAIIKMVDVKDDGTPGDQCCDFKNIYEEKFGAKLYLLLLVYAKVDRNGNCFAKNCDQTLTPEPWLSNQLVM
jgi:hypothetical protein